MSVWISTWQCAAPRCDSRRKVARCTCSVATTMVTQPVLTINDQCDFLMRITRAGGNSAWFSPRRSTEYWNACRIPASQNSGWFGEGHFGACPLPTLHLCRATFGTKNQKASPHGVFLPAEARQTGPTLTFGIVGGNVESRWDWAGNVRNCGK